MRTPGHWGPWANCPLRISWRPWGEMLGLTEFSIVLILFEGFRCRSNPTKIPFSKILRCSCMIFNEQNAQWQVCSNNSTVLSKIPPQQNCFYNRFRTNKLSTFKVRLHDHIRIQSQTLFLASSMSNGKRWFLFFLMWFYKGANMNSLYCKGSNQFVS